MLLLFFFSINCWRMCNLNSRVGVPVVKDVHCEKDRGGKHMMWNCHHPGTVGRCTAFAPMRTFIRASTSSSRPSSFMHVLVRSFVCTLMCSCTCSVFFVRSLLHSSGGSLVCLLLFRAFVGPLVCSLFHSCIRKLIRWCVCELVRFYVLLFVRWFIRAITRFLCIRSFVGALVRTLFYFSCRCSVARLLGG